MPLATDEALTKGLGSPTCHCNTTWNIQLYMYKQQNMKSDVIVKKWIKVFSKGAC